MQVDIREAIVLMLKDSFPVEFPAIPLVFDNQPFDLNKPPKLFCEVETKFYDGKQINIAANPRTRIYGMVYVTVFAREGTGNRQSLLVIDWVTKQLEYQTRSNLVIQLILQAGRPNSLPDRKGWHIEELKVPFFADPA